MGTIFAPNTTKGQLRAEIVAMRGRPEGGYFKTLAAKWAGNTLWTVHASRQTAQCDEVRFVGCYLFRRSGGAWGYKAMDESMGPCYYDCPLHFLDMVTEPTNEYAREWRHKVRSQA